MRFDFAVLILNLASLFFLVAVGFVATRANLLPTSASTPFSTLLLKITLPCTIFISLALKEYDPAFIRDSLLTIALGLAVYPSMLLLSRCAAHILRVPEGSRGIWAYSCTFTNAGFMGFPVALTLFGADGLALAVMLNITLNLYLYTIGLMELSKDSGGNDNSLNLKSIFFSPINIALALSLIFYFGGLRVPQGVAVPMTYLSDMTTPLSMLVAGIAIGRSRGKELLTSRDAYTSAAMRLVIFPLILCFLFRLLPLPNPMIAAVATIIFAMPIPSSTVVLTEMYHGNVPLAAKIMFIQNLLCMATIPVVCLLGVRA